ncbi:hypothetical protein INT43_001443 [Umbelopsis isabellina]|uniref:Uncharacterized protein n=1 Tax=Mortierella isabellina TaxID=91625 RepID=A0A8H7U8G4_MORIS|nr:hypothetical protein INT43_001443 [Umbelopsis isabellina]
MSLVRANAPFSCHASPVDMHTEMPPLKSHVSPGYTSEELPVAHANVKYERHWRFRLIDKNIAVESCNKGCTRLFRFNDHIMLSAEDVQREQLSTFLAISNRQAAITNPHVSQEAKEHSKQKLSEIRSQGYTSEESQAEARSTRYRESQRQNVANQEAVGEEEQPKKEEGEEDEVSEEEE